MKENILNVSVFATIKLLIKKSLTIFAVLLYIFRECGLDLFSWIFFLDIKYITLRLFVSLYFSHLLKFLYSKTFQTHSSIKRNLHFRDHGTLIAVPSMKQFQMLS